MIGDIKTVAHGTFDRYFRMKELYVILGLCIFLISVLGRYDELTLNMGREFMIDGALAVLAIVSVITSMSVIFEKSREIREKTAHFIIAKPSGRTSYIWGKFLGVAALSIFNIAIITIGAFFMFKMSSLDMNVDSFSTNFTYAAVLITVESFVLIAVGLFLSMFFSDTIATLLLFVVFVLGHSLYLLPRMEKFADMSWLNTVCNLFPNLFNLDMKREVTANIAVSGDYMWMGISYGLLYALAFVFLSVVIFNRKDIA